MDFSIKELVAMLQSKDGCRAAMPQIMSYVYQMFAYTLKDGINESLINAMMCIVGRVIVTECTNDGKIDYEKLSKMTAIDINTLHITFAKAEDENGKKYTLKELIEGI